MADNNNGDILVAPPAPVKGRSRGPIRRRRNLQDEPGCCRSLNLQDQSNRLRPFRSPRAPSKSRGPVAEFVPSRRDFLAHRVRPSVNRGILPRPFHPASRRNILRHTLCSQVERIVGVLDPHHNWLEVLNIPAAPCAPRQARQEMHFQSLARQMQPRKLDFYVCSDEHGDDDEAAAKCPGGDGCVKDSGIGDTEDIEDGCAKDTGIGGTENIGAGGTEDIGDKRVKDIDTKDQQE
ncbi:hypothetical protein ElyMa_006420000 [Elysia marginata]|uniref:Uncharacterized protein n=1 Tax=Elysia marginata TaxID=1093978 RepID=A0AAV4HSY5_9GAST|nr:hypothetical protein ElyMa_006420000 [Elysia marginata]